MKVQFVHFKKFLFFVLTILLISAGFTGCRSNGSGDAGGEDEDPADAKLSIVTTVFPPYDFAKQVTGELADVDMLLSPGAESHSFEPSPKDIITIQNSDVFIYVGGETDQWVRTVLESMDTSGIQLIALTDLVDLKEEEYVEGMEGGGHSHDDGDDDHSRDDDHDHDEDEDHDDHDHDEEVEFDEHVWTSPVNAMAIVKAINQAVSALDEENARQYGENTDLYLAELEELDRDFREVMDNAVRKTIVFGDRFPFRYFADEYGLDYFAAFPGCSTETEASAATIAFLINKVRDEEIPVVFHIEFSNEKMADVICEGGGAEKLLLHSCHNVTRAQMNEGISYMELMKQNVVNLKEALY